MAALTCAELVEVARIEWEKQPAAFRERAAEFLEGLAAENEGEIGLEELMRSGLVNGMGKKEFVAKIFGALDEDRKGRLSIDRCIAVYYLCLHSSRRICRSCANPILPGFAFTCLTCSSQSFFLCLPCYNSSSSHHRSSSPGSPSSSSSSSISSSHPHPLYHDYSALHHLLRRTPPHLHSVSTGIFPPPVRVPTQPLQTMKQCVVCGDFHELEAAGLMVGYHMTKLKGSANDYVCEWCFAYFCSMCGRRFRDSTANAEPAKWLQQFLCGDCSESRGASTDGYGRMITHLTAELRTSELLRQCKTCSIKHRNGALFTNLQLDNRIQTVLAQPRTISPRDIRPQQLGERVQPLQLRQLRMVNPRAFQPRHRPPPFHRPLSPSIAGSRFPRQISPTDSPRSNDLQQQESGTPQSPPVGDP